MGPPAYSEMHPSIFSLDFVYSDIEGLPVPGVRQVWPVGGVSGFGEGVATCDPSSHQGNFVDPPRSQTKESLSSLWECPLIARAFKYYQGGKTHLYPGPRTVLDSQNVATFNPGFKGVDEAADVLLQGRSGQAERREAAPGHRAPTTEHTIVAGSRNYTVVNTEKGLMEVQRMSCAGMKLSCQLKVQNSLWTATEVTVSIQGPHLGGQHRVPSTGRHI